MSNAARARLVRACVVSCSLVAGLLASAEPGTLARACAPGGALREAARMEGRDTLFGAPSCGSLAETQGASERTAAFAPTPPDWTFVGTTSGGNTGWSVASAGDVNGDGWGDVIVGAQLEDVGPLEFVGRVSVFHGSAAGLSLTPSWQVTGDVAFANFGYVVDSAGDVNGDGYDDVVVGSWVYNSGTGRAWLYLGSASGLSTTPAWVVSGSQISEWYARSLAGAGDVNGDGYDDVIVGAYGHDGDQPDEGRAFVYLGSATGLSTTPAWFGESNQSGSLYGISVAGAGDLNGDGFADVVVGGYRASGLHAEGGRAWAYLGSAGGLSTTPVWIADGPQDFAWFGSTVASAGDVNHDGFDELAVAAERYQAPGGRGAVFVFYGSVAGPAAAPGWTQTNTSGTSNRFGSSVASAGDWNKDGVEDLIIGSADFNGGPQGGFFVYFGSAIGLPPAANWTEVRDRGTGVSVASGGDVNGDGFGDLVVGAPFGDEPRGRALAYYGFRVVKGDLDGDLDTDLLLRNSLSSQLDVWLMNGVQRTQRLAVTPTPAPEWRVAGIDDFDGDRRNDLVLWNTLTGAVEFWRMDGATRLGAPVPLGGAAPLPTTWSIAATADFDRDRSPDLLWTNSLTGDLVVWRIAGLSKVGELVPTPNRPAHLNWSVVAARDWNGDWMPDLLWYNESSGRAVQWLFDPNLVRQGSRFTNPVAAEGTQWRAVAAGDYGIGPGGQPNTNDIVWRNSTNGRMVVWYMDLAGNRTAGTFTNPAEPSPYSTAWIVAGPR